MVDKNIGLVLSEVYRLKNHAYDELEKLNHPDFIYWTEDKAKYKAQYEAYDKCIEIIMKYCNE